MLLNSEQLSQYGFGWVIGSGPESGWISTYGELGWTPTDASEVRHYWALNRIWPIFDMYHAAGSLTDPMPVSLEPAVTYPDAKTHMDATVSNREYLHQSAMYKLLPLFMDGDLLPYIVTHPSDATTVDYQIDSFAVTDLGGETLQWQRDGTDIADATGATYWTTGFEDSGDYRVHVCNYGGCVYSDSAHLNVLKTLITPYCILSGSTLSLSNTVISSDETSAPIHGNGIVVLMGDISSTGPVINISSTAKITINSNKTIRANLTAPEIKLGSGTVVIGTLTRRFVPAVTIPSIDWTGYRDYATANGEYYADSTSLTTDYTSSGGISYFDASSTFDGIATFSGAIISDDTIDLSSQRRVVSAGIAIAANGISSTSSKDCTGILYSATTLTMASNTKVSGQLISGAAMSITCPNILYRPL